MKPTAQVMMAVRLTELHRVLKPTGSFYLRCRAFLPPELLE